jgi:hypothetical protein
MSRTYRASIIAGLKPLRKKYFQHSDKDFGGHYVMNQKQLLIQGAWSQLFHQPHQMEGFGSKSMS